MKQILAIARMTFWEGVRMRIVLVFVLLMVFIVLRLPFALRGDETLAGRLQTFIGYSLGAVSLLLGLATAFFSCASLSNEIRDRLIHLIVTKPVTRAQILVGKWLGVNFLNLLLLVPTGLVIYLFAAFIKDLPADIERDRLRVRDTIWTARLAARPIEPDFRALAAQEIKARVAEGVIDKAAEASAIDARMLELKGAWRSIPRGQNRIFNFEDLSPPKTDDGVVMVRFKARCTPIPIEERLKLDWLLLDPETHEPLTDEPKRTDERMGNIHQFLLRGRYAIRDGHATLVVINPLLIDPETGEIEQDVTAIFEGDKSLQILYPAGSFEMNFVKALLLLAVRLAFLAALGVFCSTILSFPVACFATLTLFVMSYWRGVWLDTIGANLTPEIRTDASDPYGHFGNVIRFVLVPLVRLLFPDFAEYDGTESLLDGIYLTNGLVAEAIGHLALYGGVLLLFGWLIFWRREVAAVTD